MGGGISILPSGAASVSKVQPYCSPCPRHIDGDPSILKSFPLPVLSPHSTPKLSDYVIGSIIGQGGFGKIREIERKRDYRCFALKSFEFEKMSVREAKAIATELLGLSRIPSHPFVIQLYAAFREISALSFVMDLLVGGDLRMLLRFDENMDERKIAYVVGCVGSALHHIHLHRVIHRDVKPENIMFTSQGIPKLIDFGIAHLSPPTSKICVCQSRSGTAQYTSPEALVPNTHCHGYESDFWSLGIVMYEMLYCRRPYETFAPCEMVEYSEKTYEAVWKFLLAQSTCEIIPVTVTSSSSTVPNSPASSLSISPIGLHSFHPIVEEGDEPALPPSLIIPLPDYSRALDTSLSENCRSLLSSLLDVRIHKRCGVGENYSAFSEHAFFISQEMSVENILSVPSPIHPDIGMVGTYVWNRFLTANDAEGGEIADIAPQQNSPIPRPEVEDYLKEIQSMTPLFYESGSATSQKRSTDIFSTLRNWGRLAS
jgi:serine/threonine protein kinase